ncbi:UDP-galactose transporter 1 [Phtheirospermum japonicum]|uniref:UDP-galactose transporter 1 n=1 Tax=Phtheirospermum japonicum TaxID=374723 RepID=A0A830BXU1_9LAMI|nr:UDP-galactose transporter 1 [Phtheirospermum japonicum]
MEESILYQWTVIRSVLAILQWWGFNVTVIIMNKWIFQKLDFKFPLTVSCIHFICSSIGAYLVIKVLRLKPLIHVDPEDRWRRIFPMSFIFCINIVLGNVSLRYIPVSFMQTIKSFTPATTVILQWLIWNKYFDWRIWASLIPIVGGILLTSITELSFNMFGFCAALFGCLATSTKTILAESLLHGYKFDSINTVYYMAPYATMILAGPAILLEGSGVVEWIQTCPSLFSPLVIIFGSGVLAFCLNFSIFYVIHSTTAVTFNVAGNLKVPLPHFSCGSCYVFVANIPKSNLHDERRWMFYYTPRMYVLRIRKALDLEPGPGNAPYASDPTGQTGVDPIS